MVRSIGRLGIVALAAITACELGSTEIPQTTPSIVVHAVLNPEHRQQTILVEESLTGAQPVVDSGPYNPFDPITTGNGVPISGAIVTLTDPTGFAMQAVEEVGTGIYFVDLDAESTRAGRQIDIERGARYFLSVSHGARTVSGSTVIPGAPTDPDVPRVPFNRDDDTLSVSISAGVQARAFWMRIEAPVSSFSLFSVDRDVHITGDTRNFFTESLIRVFTPGFEQTLTVAAIDSNLYDYYRTGSDPFTGAGLINRLEGGIGVFGSMVVLERRLVDVTQNPTGDSIEGEYTRRGGPPGGFTNVRIYLEAKGPSAEIGDQISGNYLRGPATSAARGAIYGTRKGTALDLEFLEPLSTNEGAAGFLGMQRGDSLIGVFSPTGTPAVFVKVGK
jgi:hypothetical protein